MQQVERSGKKWFYAEEGEVQVRVSVSAREGVITVSAYCVLLAFWSYICNIQWLNLYFVLKFGEVCSPTWTSTDTVGGTENGKLYKRGNVHATILVSSRGGVRTDIGLSYALTYLCPDKSIASSLRPVSLRREAPAKRKTGIFPTTSYNHVFTIRPVIPYVWYWRLGTHPFYL